MVDDPPSTKWTTSTRAKLPCGLPFSYRNELHRVPVRVWLGKRREYVRRACTSCLHAHPPPTCVCERERYKPRHNAPSIPMPPPSPTTSHHHAPLLLTLSLPPFLYTRGHYQNYNLQIYKATNTNRCNSNGVCLMVLAKEDIN